MDNRLVGRIVLVTPQVGGDQQSGQPNMFTDVGEGFFKGFVITIGFNSRNFRQIFERLTNIF